MAQIALVSLNRDNKDCLGVNHNDAVLVSTDNGMNCRCVSNVTLVIVAQIVLVSALIRIQIV